MLYLYLGRNKSSTSGEDPLAELVLAGRLPERGTAVVDRGEDGLVVRPKVEAAEAA